MLETDIDSEWEEDWDRDPGRWRLWKIGSRIMQPLFVQTVSKY